MTAPARRAPGIETEPGCNAGAATATTATTESKASGARAVRGGQAAADVQAVIDSPMGPMLLTARGDVLTGAWFVGQPDCPTPGVAATAHPVLTLAAQELADWFAGRRRDFSLPLAPQGTPFQRRVWDALLDLKFGELESYGALSRRLGNAAAVRAVAQAVGRNPISLIIPCHRIVGSDTSLTGFGGGLARKRALLTHEGHHYTRMSPKAKRVDDDPGQGTLTW